MKISAKSRRSTMLDVVGSPAGMIITLAVICAICLRLNHTTIYFGCGRLNGPNDPYIDNTGHIFQTISWHMGIGTRTWGETYGLDLRWFYVSMGLQHINPNVTPEEANE